MLPYTLLNKNDFNKLKSNLNLYENLVKSFAEKVGIKSSKYELLDIEQKLEELLATKKQQIIDEELRAWKESGLNQFMKTIRTEQHNIANLCDKILADLVGHLNANQGAIYLKEELTDDKVKLVSTYAWGKKKFIEHEIEAGDGLIGQCMLEKAEIYLTEIPDNFIQITSGLGKGSPKSIIILPLVANEQLLGVLEIASFNIFEKHQKEFLYNLVENLASSLLYEINNQKTRVLLHTTKEQQEQMRSQEEELRQNLEELQATQESQQRLNDELKNNEALLQEKLHESEQIRNELINKELELKELANKSKRRANDFRTKMEELDMKLEQKNAEINEYKRKTEVQQNEMKLQQNELIKNLEKLNQAQKEQQLLLDNLKKSEDNLRIKLLETEESNAKLEAKEFELNKISAKFKEKAVLYRNKMEEIDMLLEQKNAEINEYKRRTDIQNEILQAQEEELRQNLEELIATQEEQFKQQEDLENKVIKYENLLKKAGIKYN